MSRPVAGLLCGLAYLACLSIFLPFLPTAIGTMGHDYGLHLPNMLAGYYWFLHNGVGILPWFSPAQCGGFPYFPDPNVAYLSLPQALVILMSPVRAIQVTFCLFALIALCGAYGLMRVGFGTSRAAAVLAAGLFVFNGFFIYRVLIGHLTFHAFALAPLMVLMLLPVGRAPEPVLARLGRICVAGLCLAYMFQSGMVHGIPPVLLATAVILLVHALRFGWRWEPWLRLAAAGLLSLLLCAGKLTAELALLAHFPRDQYPLPGVPDFLLLLRMVAQMLFVSVPADPNAQLANTMWPFERNEWEYGVSIVPALLLVVAVVVGLVHRRRWKPLSGHRILMLLAIAMLLACPLLLNWHAPVWTGFLKSLPYFGNSSSLLRFFCAYIPVVIVLASLALDGIPWPEAARPRLCTASAVLCLGGVVLQNALTERDYYAGQPYQSKPIEAAYARARATGVVPPIEAIVDTDRFMVMSNDAMIAGGSQLDCYQPLLGYRREKFPVAPLRLGRVDQTVSGVLNLKNPACYLFGAENQCRPGDHFTLAQAADAEAFRNYRPFAFAQPLWQRLATWTSLLAAAITLVVLLMWGLVRRRAATPGA